MMGMINEFATVTNLSGKTLSELEKIIEADVHAYMRVGEALKAIRDHRLYRETHDTFEDYCQERWGFTRQAANYNIKAAEIGKRVYQNGEEPPTSLRAALALGKSKIKTAADSINDLSDRLLSVQKTVAKIKEVDVEWSRAFPKEMEKLKQTIQQVGKFLSNF